MKPAADEQLRTVEDTLGVVFPADYREFIAAGAGRIEGNFGGSYLALYSPDELVPLNNGYEISVSYPGLVLIGSDGGGEAIGFDFRQASPPVVLVNFVSAGWHEAIVQAHTFTEFMDQRNSGQEYKVSR